MSETPVFIIHRKSTFVNKKIMPFIENLCGQPSIYGTMQSRFFTYPEKICSLPVELLCIGLHYVSNPEYSWDGRSRGGKDPQRALIQYTVSGCGALEFDGRTFEIPCGHAMLLTFPEEHRYFLPSTSRHWEVLFATFGGEAAAPMIRMLREHFGPVAALRSEGETLYQMRELLKNDFPSTFWESASAGYRLLTTLGRELEHHDLHCPRPGFLDEVLDYCRSHVDEELSVEKLARLTGRSRWYFSREFKRVLGVSVPQYVTEMRLQKACQLLNTPHYSIKEVSAMCGFADTAYFIRCFTRRFGITPGNFRKTSGTAAPVIPQ